MNPLQHILIWAIRAYRLLISPAQLFIFGASGGCRFTPSCSQYAMDAIVARGALAGSVMAANRICRCHPFASGGHDPAPMAVKSRERGATKFC
ncbi:MAG TPA: membrane protein insertion efficiency factor YidD [Verrucomicrobiae bacterium]|jgi:hypothetical protein